MANGIRAEGLDKFTTDLLKLVSKYDDVTKKFLREQGNKLRNAIKNKARSKIKKKSGNYMKGFDKTKPKVNSSTCYIKVFNNAKHAHLIEYGTVKRSNYSKKNANRGFMKGAFILEETSKEFADSFSEAIKEKLVDDLLKEGAF